MCSLRPPRCRHNILGGGCMKMFKRAMLVVGLAVYAQSCGGSSEASGPSTPPAPQTPLRVLGDSALTFSPFPTVGLFQEFIQTTGLVYLVEGTTSLSTNVSWTSSNSSVVEVSSTGAVKAVSPGTAVVTATYLGRSANKSIIVASTVTGLSLSGPAEYSYSPSSLRPQSGRILASATLAPQFRPRFPTHDNVGSVARWQSSNAQVVTVTDSGVLSAVGVGRATVSASLTGQNATIEVTVTGAPLNLTGTYRGDRATFVLTQVGNAITGTADIISDSFLNRSLMGVRGTVTGATVDLVLNRQSVCPAPTIAISSATSASFVGGGSGPPCLLSSFYSFAFSVAR